MPSTATISSGDTSASRWWYNPAVILAGAVALGHAPMALLHLRSLWRQEQYQYFPFVIGAIGLLLWTRWREAPASKDIVGQWNGLPAWIVTASLALLLGAILTVSPWLAFVSLNIGLAAVFILLYRQRMVEYLWGIWLLLWLMVPLPLNVDARFVRSLQRTSSRLSSDILDLLGILHFMGGNVLRLPTKEFFVDEACSGIISVMSMIACAAIYAVWKNRSLLHLVALVLMGVTWALVLNVLRICIIAGAYHYYDIDLSTGTVHELLGLALFLLMFLALVSSDYLLELVFEPIDTSLLGVAAQDNLLVRWWNSNRQTSSITNHDGGESVATGLNDHYPPSLHMPSIIGASIAFLILGVVQLVWVPSSDTPEAATALAQALALDESSLPPVIGPWMRESFEGVEREALSEFGRYSRTYRYRHREREGIVATVSLDFPYLGGWHDLCVCYRTSGWTVDERTVDSLPNSPQTDWSYVSGKLTDSAMGEALVSFAGFDALGEHAEPPNDAVLFRPWFRLRRRLLLNLAPQLYQVQVFATLSNSDDQQIQQQLEELLSEVRVEFRDRVAATAAD